MNERIKELAEQCATPERFDVAKFAELIVRECAQIGEDVDGNQITKLTTAQ